MRGYQIGQEREAQQKAAADETAAMNAMTRGMSAQQWQPPAGDTIYDGPNGQPMSREDAAARAAPAGGYAGGISALQGLGADNAAAGRLTSQLLMNKMERDQTIADRDEQRKYDSSLKEQERAFEMQKYGIERKDEMSDAQAERDFEMKKLAAMQNVDMRKLFDKLMMEDQMARARIDYEKGMGGTAPDGTMQVSETAQPTVGPLGVPFADSDPLEGLPISEKGKTAASIREQTIKDFAAGREAVDQARNVSDRLGRFVGLIDQGLNTGAQYKIPGAQDIMSGLDDQVSEAKSIIDMMTPMMRQGMPGAASDRDVAMFRGATVGLDKPEQANRNIAAGLMASRENLVARDQFMQAYFDQNKHLQGADRAWQRYLDANPIFDPNAKEGSYALNPNRRDWMEYFSNPSEPKAPQASAAPQSEQEAASAPVGTIVTSAKGIQYQKVGNTGTPADWKKVESEPMPTGLPGASGIR
jgi:hypothetical protein